MRVPLSFLLCGLALVGCTGGDGDDGPAFSQPPVTAFAEGTCRVVAPDVLEIGRQAQRLGEGGKIEPEVLTALEKAQTALRPVAEGAEPALQPALTRLVVATGLVRLQARVESYKTETGEDLQKTYDDAVAACTAGASPSP